MNGKYVTIGWMPCVCRVPLAWNERAHTHARVYAIPNEWIFIVFIALTRIKNRQFDYFDTDRASHRFVHVCSFGREKKNLFTLALVASSTSNTWYPHMSMLSRYFSSSHHIHSYVSSCVCCNRPMEEAHSYRLTLKHVRTCFKFNIHIYKNIL